MHPVNVDLIQEIYLLAVPLVGHSEALVSAFLTTAVGFMDAGLVGWLAGKAVNWAINRIGGGPKRVALALALRGEYCIRHGGNQAALLKAWDLTNCCSVCRNLGHNKTNHPRALQPFLREYDLLTAAVEVCEKIEDAADTATSWSDVFSLF